MDEAPPPPTTDYQRKLDALARSMAASNPNAAIDLAHRLRWYVQQARRLAPGALELNLNFVTGQLEFSVNSREEKTMNICVICGKSNGLFELRIEEDSGEITRYVCGQCWGTIANIALRAVGDRFDALEARLAELEDHEVSPYEAAMIVERAKVR